MDFDVDGLLVASSEAGSVLSTTYTYTDADLDGTADQIASETDPFGRTTTYGYSGGQITSITDHAGRTSTLNFDGSGRLLSITEHDPDGAGSLSGKVTTFTYDSVTSLMLTRTEDGKTWTYNYDENRLLRSSTGPDGATTVVPQDLYGLVNPSSGVGTSGNPASLALSADISGSRTDSGSGTVTFKLNGFGHRVYEEFENGLTVTYERNEESKVTREERDPDGFGPLAPWITLWQYDALGNVALVTHPDGSTEAWVYDATFNRSVSYTNQLGQQTVWQLDSTTGVVTETRRIVGLNDTTSSENDDVVESRTFTATGLLETTTDPLGRVTRFYYQDPNFGDLVTKIVVAEGTPDETQVEMEYDTDGNLTARIDGLGRRTEFTHDELGRVVTMTLADPDGPGSQAAPVYVYAYNQFGQIASETDPLNRVASYTYVNGKLETTTTPDHDGNSFPTVTTFGYDTAGRLASIVDPLGRQTERTYTSMGALESTKLPNPVSPSIASTTTTFEYDAFGRTTKIIDALGNETELAYADFGKSITTTLPDPDGVGSGSSPVVTQTYNALGMLLSQTDPLGHVTDYIYDELNRLDQLIQRGGGGLADLVTDYNYDLIGNLRFVTDPLGNAVEFVYDDLDRLVQTILPDPDGAGPLSSPTYSSTFDAAGQLVSETDALSRVTSYAYDNLGRLITTTLPVLSATGVSPVLSFAYDAVGNLTSQTDALGNTTNYAYDSHDNLISTTLADPDGAGPLLAPVYQYSYNDAGQLLTGTNSLGDETSYTYDGLGRVITTTLPLLAAMGASPVYSYTYNLIGNVLTETDANGNVTTHSYDNLYRRTQTALPVAGAVYNYSYDAASRLVTEFQPLNRSKSFNYDGFSRVTKITGTDPDGAGPQQAQFTEYEYDDAGNVLLTRDNLNNETLFSYDNLYRLLSQTDALSGVTSYTYDAAGNTLSLTDPVLNTTAWVYDELDRVIEETNQLDGTRYFGYDLASNLTSKIDRNGRLSEFDYDNLHRQIEERWVDGNGLVFYTSNFDYNALSQLVGASDDNSAYSLAYDELGRRTSIDNTGTPNLPSVVLTSGYDAIGNRTSLSANIDGTDDFVNTYQFDALSRMTQVTQDAQVGTTSPFVQKEVDFTYNAASQFTGITRYEDGIYGLQEVATSTYSYDNAGRLTSLDHNDGASSMLASYGWTFDDLGRISSVTSIDGTSDYTYDDTNQLVSTVNSFTSDETYSYDANGNRTLTGYVVGANNQITSDGTYNYDYDAEGNLIRRTHIVSNEVEDYVWDNHNRLTRILVTAAGPTKVKDVYYTYDVFGHRIIKEIDWDGDNTIDETNKYIHDGLRGERGNAGDHIVLAFDGADDLTNRYLHGPNVDQVLADEQIDLSLGTSEVVWTLTDHLGSVRDLVTYADVSFIVTVVNHLQFDSFGNLINETGTGTTIYGFTGREIDRESIFQFNRERYYISALGVWASEDPIGFTAGDMNIRRYVSNSPVNLIDPSGLETPWFLDSSKNGVDGAVNYAYDSTFGAAWRWMNANPKPAKEWIPEFAEKDRQLRDEGLLPTAEELGLPNGDEATFCEIAHYTLDVTGTVDPVFSDGLNALIYTVEGDGKNAAISVSAYLPWGEAAKWGKYSKFGDELGSVGKHFDHCTDGADEIADLGDDIRDFRKWAKKNGMPDPHGGGTPTGTARGRANEKRVLADMGELKNNTKHSTSEGNIIPDFDPPTMTGDIKDTKTVSLGDAQMRGQREYAQSLGKEHVVVTGDKTKVFGQGKYDTTVIRRPDIGPQ